MPCPSASSSSNLSCPSNARCCRPYSSGACPRRPCTLDTSPHSCRHPPCVADSLPDAERSYRYRPALPAS
eukprot:3372687-Heterocapsa_arctica.AAC.1